MCCSDLSLGGQIVCWQQAEPLKADDSRLGLRQLLVAASNTRLVLLSVNHGLHTQSRAETSVGSRSCMAATIVETSQQNTGETVAVR